MENYPAITITAKYKNADELILISQIDNMQTDSIYVKLNVCEALTDGLILFMPN